MSERGYQNVIEAFDNEAAQRFLSEDGEGGFARGVRHMLAYIAELEGALQMARDYIVEDRGGEPEPGPPMKTVLVDYGTVVIDRIDKALNGTMTAPTVPQPSTDA